MDTLATTSPMDDKRKRERYTSRLAALKSERSSWVGHWREIAEYLAPRRVRFFRQQANKGTKKNQRIINGSPGKALRTLAAGMMAGITSPARLWFRLAADEPELAEIPEVKAWLAIATQRVFGAFGRSNFYKAAHELYGTLGGFGTGVFILEADEEHTIRAYTVPLGEFCLAQSDRGVVDTLYQETSLTVDQVVRKFGLGSVSARVKNLYDHSRYDEQVEVVRVIEPRRDRDTSKVDAKNMKFASCWFEVGSESQGGFLRESGFEENPILAPRWDVLGNDTYGSGPGMDALGDIKAMQLYESDKALVIAKIADPPMGAPGSLRNRPVSLLPGELTYFDKVGGGNGVEPLITVHPGAVQALREAIQDHVQRVDSDFFADLWLMLSRIDQAQPITAREVAERHEEKLLQLGPVMERLDDEFLDLAVERAVGICTRSGLIPLPPKVLQDQHVTPQYTNIMTEAQKMIGATGIQRLAGFVGQLGAVKPEAYDKLNSDKMIDRYADATGADPELLNSDDKVAQIRAQRAKAQAAAAQQQQAQQNALAAAKAGKDLASADTSGDNALTRMMGGPAAAQAGSFQ